MTQTRIPFSLSLDSELIEDMKYYYNTVEFNAESLSKIIESILRPVIPSRALSVTTPTES